MENHLHISFKNLLVYFVATLLSIISLSYASNPFTSDEFDDVFRSKNFTNTYRFAFNSELILQVQITNDTTKYQRHQLNLKSLDCDKELWDIVNDTIINDRTYNASNLLNNIYDRTFVHINSSVRINFQFLFRDNALQYMQSVSDFKSKIRLQDRFFNYLSNEFSTDLSIMAIHKIMDDKAKEDKKTNDLLASVYL